MSADTWQILISILGLIVNGAGLSFVAIQVNRARRQANIAQAQQQAERARQKRQATLDFSVSTMDVRHNYRSLLPDDFDVAEIDELLSTVLSGQDSEHEKIIIQYLGYVEYIAVGVSLGIHDLEKVDSLYGSRMIAAWTNYGSYIAHYRKAWNKDYFCGEIEWLAGAIEEFRRQNIGYGLNGEYVPLSRRRGRLET